MNCKKCESTNLQIVKSGPHKKLICSDCLTFQKFLSESEAKTFQGIVITNPAPHWQPADPAVEKYMVNIKAALDRAGLPQSHYADIYNRAYETIAELLKKIVH